MSLLNEFFVCMGIFVVLVWGVVFFFDVELVVFDVVVFGVELVVGVGWVMIVNYGSRWVWLWYGGCFGDVISDEVICEGLGGMRIS